MVEKTSSKFNPSKNQKSNLKAKPNKPNQNPENQYQNHTRKSKILCLEHHNSTQKSKQENQNQEESTEKGKWGRGSKERKRKNSTYGEIPVSLSKNNPFYNNKKKNLQPFNSHGLLTRLPKNKLTQFSYLFSHPIKMWPFNPNSKN